MTLFKMLTRKSQEQPMSQQRISVLFLQSTDDRPENEHRLRELALVKIENVIKRNLL